MEWSKCLAECWSWSKRYWQRRRLPKGERLDHERTEHGTWILCILCILCPSIPIYSHPHHLSRRRKTLLSISQSSAVGEIAGLGAEKFLLVRGIRLLRLVRALRHGAIAGGFFGVLWGSLGSTGPGCSSTSRSCGASWQVMLHLCRQPICCKCANHCICYGYMSSCL